MHEPSITLWLIPGQGFSRVMPQSQVGNNLLITYDGYHSRHYRAHKAVQVMAPALASEFSSLKEFPPVRQSPPPIIEGEPAKYFLSQPLLQPRCGPDDLGSPIMCS